MILPTFHYGLTVFTPFRDDVNRKLSWFKYQIPGCYWGQTSEKAFNDYDVYKENQCFVRIPVTDAFTPYGDWITLPENTKKDRFCIAPGSVVINGFIEDVIPDNKSETDLMKKYGDRCFKVNILKINTAIPLAAHYYASGV